MLSRFRNGFAVLVFLIAAPSFAALNAYLKIDTIPGEATDPSHAGWIEIQSWSWGVSNAAPTAMAAAGARCSLHSLNVTKRVDKASPLLARSAMAGAPIPNLTLEVNGERHMLQNVVIGSVRQTR